MRAPRVRFTIRWLMLAVAVACGFAAWSRDRARRELDRIAEESARLDRLLAARPRLSEPLVVTYGRLAGFHASMEKTCRQSAKNAEWAFRGAVRDALEESREREQGWGSDDGIFIGEARRAALPQGWLPGRVQRYRDSASLMARHAAFHAGLKAKYRRAVRRPWLPVEPDPPPPK